MDSPLCEDDETTRLPRRGLLAITLVPVLVLAALTAVIGDLLAAGEAFVVVASAIGWLVYEMHHWLRAIAAADEAADPGAYLRLLSSDGGGV